MDCNPGASVAGIVFWVRPADNTRNRTRQAATIWSVRVRTTGTAWNPSLPGLRNGQRNRGCVVFAMAQVARFDKKYALGLFPGSSVFLILLLQFVLATTSTRAGYTGLVNTVSADASVQAAGL